ncbi:MAG TPA: RNA polymerase sigma factor [Cyclobacteriaceae bacterium]|nr:RNA polymerase sigma factor [Cyclobacteriaceae bacterium]
MFTEWLVLGCQHGDAKAFDLLVKRWHPKVLKMAYWHSKSGHAAKDIAQETWAGVVKGIDKLHDPARFPVWLNQIVYRKSVDWVRNIQKQRRVGRNEVKESMHAEDGDDSDRLEQVMKHLQALPEDQKIILTLFYLKGHNIREISEILTIPLGTVKSRLFGAREHLKKKINF